MIGYKDLVSKIVFGDYTYILTLFYFAVKENDNSKEIKKYL